MTCRIIFVKCERCFQESMHQLRELPVHQEALTQRQATKGLRNGCINLEHQRMGLPIARYLGQQKNGMPPIKGPNSMPIEKNSRFQLEQKRIIPRGIPKQL